jgi:cobalt-zinc-cadmium efflux system outer membrane protein
MFGVASVRLRACALHVRGRFVSVTGLVLASCAASVASAAPSAVSAASPSVIVRSEGPGDVQGPATSSAAGALAGATLERAAFVSAVLRRNPSLESARQGWRAARARVAQAGTFDDPMLQVAVAPLSIGSAQAPLGYDVELSQRLPWFGKRSLDSAIAAAEADAVRQDYESARRELALTAFTLYGQYFLAERAIEINHSHLALMRDVRDAVTAQLGSGHASARDSLQAEAELAHLDHEAMVLATEREVIVAQMNELLHRAPELSLPPSPARLPELTLLDAPRARLELEALASRPELEALRSRVRREEAREQRADRESFPDLTVSAAYDSMWEMPQHRWMIGLGLNLPLVTGRRASAIDEARAVRAQLENDLARSSDAARTQVFVAIEGVSESEHVIALFETRLLPNAREQIDAARAGFVVSRDPLSAVIEAERNLRNVELEAQRARVEYARRWAELERALGRMPGLNGAREVER